MQALPPAGGAPAPSDDAAFTAAGRLDREDHPMLPAPIVHGIDLDPQTRCAHWHSPLDVIAIRMACCGTYYACKDCHQALADHPLRPWPRGQRDARAVLCGVCRHQMTIAAYLACESTCPACAAPFNPGCAKHYPDYFAP